MLDDRMLVDEMSEDPRSSFLNADQRAGAYANGKPSYTVAQAAVQIDRLNDTWTGTIGKGATISYSFRTSAPSTMPSGTTGFSQFTFTQQAQAKLALQSWADVANVSFVQASGSSGQIVFSDFTGGSDTSVAFTYFPPNGDVWVNSSYSYEATPVYLGYGRQTLVHEIGHALGLDHPGDYDADDGTPTYAADAIYYEDSRQYTVMSYWSETNTGANFNGSYASAPLLDDIAAIQRLYGANMSTRVGDTIYGFNSNTGLDYYTATGASSPLIFSAWDAGGNDTFDFSGYGVAQTIDLRQGYFSSVGGLVGNVSVAMGAVIENAIGGSGNDVINGNSANNRLSGGAGDDTISGLGGRDVIDGGDGSDTLIVSGARASYSIFSDGGSYFIIGAGDGDQVSNIEFVRFADLQTSWASLAANAGAFDVAEYLDSNTDLIRALGTDLAAGAQHFVTSGFGEGRAVASFDPLRYVASNPDLIRALGANALAAEQHYLTYGFKEGRATTSFDPYNYEASNPDLIKAFGLNATAAEQHYITSGFKEGRSTGSFDALEYLASNPDLIKALGDNPTAAEMHYVSNGYAEGRSVNSFDALKYIASYGDLIKAFGEDVVSATKHYVDSGYAEGRSASFDPLAYAAASPDLAKAFGTDAVAAEKHYIDYGYKEGRPTSGFDAVAYALTYQDLGKAGLTIDQDLTHWLTYGAKEGRVGDSLFGREQTNHAASTNGTTHDTLGTATDHDWFQVTLSAGQSIDLSLAAKTFDPLLQIFDDHGVLQSQAQGATTGAAASATFTAAQAGVYYVATAAIDTHMGDYDLTIHPH